LLVSLFTDGVDADSSVVVSVENLTRLFGLESTSFDAPTTKIKKDNVQALIQTPQKDNITVLFVVLFILFLYIW